MQNDPELIYLENITDLVEEMNTQAILWNSADRLIDSHGRLFTISLDKQEALPMISFSGTVLHLDVILGLLKAHFASQNHCCVAKLYAPDIESAFGLIRTL